jgi:hypothetical protein
VGRRTSGRPYTPPPGSPDGSDTPSSCADRNALRGADGGPQRISQASIGNRARLRLGGFPVAVRAWGDLHTVLTKHATDRLDPKTTGPHLVDESADQRRRGSSFRAKKAAAARRISLASFRSRSSRLSSLIRCCSELVAPGRWWASTWACNVHRRSDSAPTPTFGPIAWRAA